MLGQLWDGYRRIGHVQQGFGSLRGPSSACRRDESLRIESWTTEEIGDTQMVLSGLVRQLFEYLGTNEQSIKYVD